MSFQGTVARDIRLSSWVRVALFALAFSGLIQSCSLTTVVAREDSDAAVNIKPHGKTTWAYAWGLVQPTPIQADCDEKSISKVRVRTNLGFALITVATAGIVMPQRVEWDCSPPDVPTEPLN